MVRLTPSESDAVVLEAVNLYKRFPSGHGYLDVLQGVNLWISRGQILSIVGASGVGKSTLLHILGALERPTRGRVILHGAEVFSLPEQQVATLRNRAIGFVFQFHHLLPEFTALENVMMPLLIGGMARVQAARRAAGLLGEVGLTGREEHKPTQLSGGEQQRVAVARALINNPQVVLADEPSGNLDAGNSRMLHDLIWKLRETRNQAFVIVTHNESLAQRADVRKRLVDGVLVDLETDAR